MPNPHFERLSALDAAMVFMDTPAAHMHVGVVCICENGAHRRAGGGIDVDRIRAHIAGALDRMPRHRQRLAFIPLEHHPVWVDDATFNLRYHVHHACLPHPGDDLELKRTVGRILSQKLDLTKPLWELWVIEGLAGGRFALVKKLHHCMVDGTATVRVMSSLLSPGPERVRPTRHRWRARPAPDALQLGVAELLRWSGLPLALSRSLRAALRAPAEALTSLREVVIGALETIESRLPPAARTPLSPGRIGPHRRFDWLRIDLDRTVAIKNRAGVSLNDVLLAVVAGAARSYLAAHDLTPGDLDFRVVVPFSTRSDAAREGLGNRIAPVLVRLPLECPRPLDRLRRVAAETRALKQSGQVHAVEVLAELSDWADAALLSAVARRITRWWAGNMIVTNIPGPAIPLYFDGARVLECYPCVPILSNQSVSIAVVSYAGKLYWGFNADWDAVPDLHELVARVEREVTTLERALQRSSRRTPRRVSAASRRR